MTSILWIPVLWVNNITDQKYRLGPRKWTQKGSMFGTTRNGAYSSIDVKTRKAKTQVFL